MSERKKYNIVKTIEDDAPFGNINWCSISFLSPEKVEKTKYLDVRGFKVHDGYNTFELANDDAKKIKKQNNSHDVFLSQMGKIYAWDDATRSDSVEYDNEKLNSLEKTRRDNLAKSKLMKEQITNEYKSSQHVQNNNRVEIQRKRIQQKLYERGLITQKEYEMIQKEEKKMNGRKDISNTVEIDECFKTDYLDENPNVGLKFGCISFYSPEFYKGLSTLCFKIRGMFQTPNEVNKRIKTLKTLYPNDRIYTFEIGKWCAYSDNDKLNNIDIQKKLNYAMKCHLDHIKTEEEEFEKRRDELKKQTMDETKVSNMNKRKEKRKAKKNKENKEVPDEPIGNEEDEAGIQKIMEYLNDPELNGKYMADESSLKTFTVDV